MSEARSLRRRVGTWLRGLAVPRPVHDDVASTNTESRGISSLPEPPEIQDAPGDEEMPRIERWDDAYQDVEPDYDTYDPIDDPESYVNNPVRGRLGRRVTDIGSDHIITKKLVVITVILVDALYLAGDALITGQEICP
jgi:hypothetical protein